MRCTGVISCSPDRMAVEMRIALEGQGADAALAALLGIEGLEGPAVPAEELAVTKDGGLLFAIGIISSVIGIPNGVIAIADKIIAWRTEQMAKAVANRERLSGVLEDGQGRRLVLFNATHEHIVAALQTLVR